jgi:hypothetical protein
MAVTACLLLSACDYLGTEPGEDEDPALLTTIHLTGTVVDDGTGDPIGSAIVRLGSGATPLARVIYFSISATTDGTFVLETLLGHRPGECGYWLSAGAAGYIDLDSDSSLDVLPIECVATEQAFEIGLTPLNP